MSDIRLKLLVKGINTNSILVEQEKALQKAIKGLAMSTYDDIVQSANKNLVSSTQDYIKSLDFKDFGNLYIITITEPGIYFEDGFNGFDIKKGLLNGPKAKTTKDGHRYNIIPFQHRPTSEVVKEKKPDYYQELKKTVSNMQRIMPREIRDRAGQVVGQVIAKAKRDEQGVTAGLVKVEKQYGKKKGFTYLTFRVVSDKSDSGSWTHPGYKGLKAFDDAEKILDSRIDGIIETIFGV